METIVDRVRAVYIYPIKGAGPATINGHSPDSLALGPNGFEVDGIADRDFVLYDVADQTFVTPRGWDASRHLAHPQDRELATVKIDIHEGKLLVSSRLGGLALDAAHIEGPIVRLDMFGKKFTGVDQGDEAAAYFSRLLQPPQSPVPREIRLLRADRSQPRMMSQRYWSEGMVVQLAGQDGKPLSLESLASWRAIGLPDEEIIRTRPNLVIDGQALGAFGEDRIDPRIAFMIGTIGALIVGPIARCPVPNIDPATGTYDGLVSRALKGRIGESDLGDSGMFFGQALTYAWREGQAITVGDKVEISSLSDVPNVRLRGK